MKQEFLHSSAAAVRTNNQASQIFTEIQHNKNQFVLMLLQREGKTCKTCKIEFLQRKQIIPFNMVAAHKGLWLYPNDGNCSKTKASKMA